MSPRPFPYSSVFRGGKPGEPQPPAFGSSAGLSLRLSLGKPTKDQIDVLLIGLVPFWVVPTNGLFPRPESFPQRHEQLGGKLDVVVRRERLVQVAKLVFVHMPVNLHAADADAGLGCSFELFHVDDGFLLGPTIATADQIVDGPQLPA